MKHLMITAMGAATLLASSHLFAADGETLYKTKACVACHQIDTKVVGPAYKDVAAKYAGQDGAVETVANHIKNGVSGIWGPIPMPANQVTDEEARILAEWVLSQ